MWVALVVVLPLCVVWLFYLMVCFRTVGYGWSVVDGCLFAGFCCCLVWFGYFVVACWFWLVLNLVWVGFGRLLGVDSVEWLFWVVSGCLLDASVCLFLWVNCFVLV